MKGTRLQPPAPVQGFTLIELMIV
ncbi:MAG: prepilin-type N-terminal cleavage/methylation domain-containing protein, partial [Gammaproteobacteria bacterium]|nr:prepilin-type N-terminal cleavage/methylation domain-containing protein [Gammaproteobacteria bacterium]